MIKKEKLTYEKLKLILIILHIFFVFMIAYGATLIYTNENFGKGLFYINKETYEDSPGFIKKIEDDVKYIFTYERYKHIFEKNGKLDIENKIFSISKTPAKEDVYTIKDVLNYAKKRGIYIDENYEFSDFNTEKNEDKKYIVNWKTYDDLKPASEPSDAYMSFEELTKEVLSLLSEYYKAYKNIKVLKRDIYYDITYSSYRVYSLDKEDIKELSKYIIISSDIYPIENTFWTVPKELLKEANEGIYDEKELSLLKDDYEIALGIDTNYPNKDIYYQSKLQYIKERNLYFLASIIIFIFGFLLILDSLILYFILGKENKGDKNIKLNSYDLHSIEFKIILALITIVLLLVFNEVFIYKFIKIVFPEKFCIYINEIFKYFFVYIVIFINSLSVIKTIKAKKIWESSFLKRINDEGSVCKNKDSFSKRYTVDFFVYYLVNFITAAIIVYYFGIEDTLVDRFIIVFLIFVLIFINIFVFYRRYKRELDLDKITEYVELINLGESRENIDVEDFNGKEKILAIKLKNIGSGLDKAINERVKSEKLKANLITNVSHDIKTPLTSIINYIDLIKREKVDNENILKYINILEEKSLRLKNLTEDLLEASKASSGNVTVDFVEIDLVQLVMQVNAEFEDKYKDRQLSIISKFSKNRIFIKADSRHLWRVFENIYTNAGKYSIENSRIYIDVYEEENNTIFTMKNISKSELNISPDELELRFVRGDVSRATEGSGLGLSIAKSLIEVQDAKMQIEIDGDLFKISLIFKTEN